MSTSNISDNSTHDLWIEARQFQIDMTRPNPSTIQLVVSRPVGQDIVDGYLVLLSTKAITATSFPQDGTRYAASTSLSSPADVLDGAQVIAFYSNILNQPMPSAVAGGRITETLTITGAVPDTLYYASVHAASNILQYYPLGVQSYPLESSRIEKDSSTYTGNLPSYPAPPLNPTPGTVYYDTTLRVVQFWDATVGAWIPTRADSIISGEVTPGVVGQVFMVPSEAQLKAFNGRQWVVLDASNLQVRVGPGWQPFTGKIFLATKEPEEPVTVGDIFYSYTTQRLTYWDGTTWTPATETTTLFNTGTATVPAFTVPFTVVPFTLPTPYPGLLFYNLKKKILEVFTGTSWIQANTDQEGTPSTDKIAIGNDGSYKERIRLIKVLQGQLGYPTVCNELNEEHFNIAIDNAIETYRQLSSGAYRMQYVLFTLMENQQTYYLNSPVDKTDRIVTVNKVHRLNILGSNSLSWDSNIYFQTFLNQYYSAGYVDILSIHMLHTLSEEFKHVFAGDMPFLWNEASREFVILRRIARNEKIIIECNMERTEQELLIDRWCKQWLQAWSMAELKEMLGLIRSKYSSGIPGAGGNITLNGELLISEARQDFLDLRQQLFDYEAGGLTENGNVSFLLG
jgi:hypothetical protein